MLPRQGVVSKVFTKEVAEDQYGNKYLVSFKLEGDDTYYGCGKKKYPKLSIKVGKNFHDVAEGDTIAFFAEETEWNGKTYFNVKSSQISLVGAGAAPASRNASRSQPAAAPRSQGGGASAPRAAAGGFSGNELSIKAGRAVNAAVSLVTSGYFKGTLEEALAVAIGLERYADANYNSLYELHADGAKLDQAVAERHKQQQEEAHQKQDDDEFDDDIPF